MKSKLTYIRNIIGLINMLLMMQEDITLYVNGKRIPDCWSVHMEGGYIVFCLMSETNLNCTGHDRIHIWYQSIDELTIIGKDGEMI